MSSAQLVEISEISACPIGYHPVADYLGGDYSVPVEERHQWVGGEHTSSWTCEICRGWTLWSYSSDAYVRGRQGPVTYTPPRGGRCSAASRADTLTLSERAAYARWVEADNAVSASEQASPERDTLIAGLLAAEQGVRDADTGATCLLAMCGLE